MGIITSSLRVLLHRTQALFRATSADTPSSSVYLPNELVSNILSRVPEGCLCRFRCVSKEWCALVSDPAFVAAHKSRAQPFLVVASLTHATGLRLTDLDGNVVRVIGDKRQFWKPMPTSPDDAICVVGYPDNGRGVGVIDLATMNMLVTPLEVGREWAFGRAVPSGAYKMVRFQDSAYCEVFTVGDGAGWRRRESRQLRYQYFTFNYYIATVNGRLYCLPKDEFSTNFILRFDLESEEWKDNIGGPPNVKLWWHNNCVGELSGALCLSEPKNWKTSNGYTNIWLLTDPDNSIWVKEYMIPLDLSIPLDSALRYWMTPLRVLDDGSKLLIYYNAGSMGVERPPILQIYDPHDGTWIDVTKRLLGDYGHIVGFCNSHLGRSASANIQPLVPSFCLI